MGVALYLRAHHVPATRRSAAPAEGFIARLRRTVRRWRDRHDERKALAQLTDRELRDFGMSHWEAVHEATKPFWRS